MMSLIQVSPVVSVDSFASPHSHFLPPTSTTTTTQPQRNVRVSAHKRTLTPLTTSVRPSLVQKRKLDKRSKKVTFSVETKSWDGLRESEADFDELLFCFLVKGQSIGDGDILRWTSSDYVRIFNMSRLMSDMIARLRDRDPENKGDRQIPCLPRGGGRAIKVERTYEPYLISLLSVLLTALEIAFNSQRGRSFDKLQGQCIARHELERFLTNKTQVENVIQRMN